MDNNNTYPGIKRNIIEKMSLIVVRSNVKIGKFTVIAHKVTINIIIISIWEI